MSEVAALILAAGRGTRFGAAPKLLAALEGRSLVRRVGEAAAASRARPILAVTGHLAEAVEAELAGLGIRFVRNPAYADGLSTSLKAGFAALPPEAEAVLVLLGDMPLITGDRIDRLAEAWAGAGRPAALVPTVQGRRGNPVVLSRTLAPAIGRLEGDAGAGPILRGRADVVEWPTGDTSFLHDVDTADALARLRG